MDANKKLYGEANIFPALSPIGILSLSYIVEGLFGSQLPESAHGVVVAVATIFTYGIIFLSPLSYLTFKHLVLPALNMLSRRLKIQSYFLNTIIILFVTEIILVTTVVFIRIAHEYPIQLWHLIAVAAIPTAFVALNCFGHIMVFKFGISKCADA